MPRDELTRRLGAKALHHVVDAGRHTNRIHHLAQQGCCAWRFLRWLDNNCVAAGQRRGDFPGHQKEWRVPRTYDSDDTLWLSNGVVKRATAVRRVHLKCLGGHIFDDVCEDLEICRAAWDKRVGYNVVGLTGIGLLRFNEVIKAAGDLVCNSVQHRDTLVCSHASPRPLKC